MVIYKGQEKHILGREGQGPGAYEVNHDSIAASASRRSQYTNGIGVSQGDRGLLTLKMVDSPGPHSYNQDTIPLKKNRGFAIMPQATRDIDFAKCKVYDI